MAIRALRSPDQGFSYVWLDADYSSVTTLDLSSLYRDGQDTIVWRSGPLPYGKHNVTIMCGGLSGAFSNNGQDLSVAGFLVLGDARVVQQCESSQDPGGCLA